MVGDLAGILAIATSDKQSEEEKQLMCQHTQEMTKNQMNSGFSQSFEDKVVAGGRSALGLQPPYEGKNIAGAHSGLALQPEGEGSQSRQKDLSRLFTALDITTDFKQSSGKTKPEKGKINKRAKTATSKSGGPARE